MEPVSGQTYTLAEVFQLDLLDSPFLMVNGIPIQTGSFTEAMLLKSSIGNTNWTYRHTTNEWCPIFDGEVPIEALEIDPSDGLIYPKEAA